LTLERVPGSILFLFEVPLLEQRLLRSGQLANMAGVSIKPAIPWK